MHDATDVPMLDYTDEGVKLRDEAIARVDVPSFSKLVCQVIEGFDRYRFFTTDDVWEHLAKLFAVVPKEPRAMGAAMMRARKLRLCVPTNQFQPTRRKQAHKSPQRIWQRVADGPS